MDITEDSPRERSLALPTTSHSDAGRKEAREVRVATEHIQGELSPQSQSSQRGSASRSVGMVITASPPSSRGSFHMRRKWTQCEGGGREVE
ncbi:hypothetical protein ACOMHN_018765 [Nucella lapillus]